MSNLADDGDQLAGKYGFWADPYTFVLDPPRRHLTEYGVSIVRRLSIDPGIITAATVETIRKIRVSLVLDMVANTDPAADLVI